MKLLTPVLLSLFLFGCNEEVTKPAGRAVDLVFSSLEEEIPLKLQHLSVDKPIVMNVWATWCPPCIKELPSLQVLADTKEFTVLAVSIDRKAELVKAFLHQNGFHKLPVVWDENGKTLKQNFGLNGIPTTYILDGRKEILAIEKGERNWAHPDMIAKIKTYVAKAAAEAAALRKE